MPRPWAAGVAAVLATAGLTHAAEPPSLAAETHATANFVVTAPTQAIARTVAAQAERQRVAVARWWFGEDPPAWAKPCRVRVTLAPGPSAGATAIDFAPGTGDTPVVAFAAMDLRGDLRPLLASTLPHELTHLAFAHHFGKPLPRWADEGVALLSEAAPDQAAHDARVRDLLTEGRGIRVKVLIRMTEYPPDLMAAYTQGHSLVRFLARTGGEARLPWGLREQAGATKLVRFIRRGTDGNSAESWDKAASEVYGFESVDALEEAWLAWVKAPGSVLAAGAAGHTARPLEREVAADMIPPTEVPGSGQPVMMSAPDGGE